MPSVIIRLRVVVTHDRFGGERLVAAFPRDRVRDLIARLLIEAGIEDDPRDWELFDGTAVLSPNHTVRELLSGEPPRDGWGLRRTDRSVRPRVTAPAAPAAALPPPATPPAPPPPPTGPATSFADILLAKRIISPEQLEEARHLPATLGLKLQAALIKLGYATPAEVMSAIAEKHGMAFVDLTKFEIPKTVIELVPESVARENLVLPLALDGNTLTVVISDPTDFDTLQKLEFILNKTILPGLATQEQIRDAINRYYGGSHTESVDSMLVEFTDTAIEFTQTESLEQPPPAPGAPPQAPPPEAPTRRAVAPAPARVAEEEDLEADDLDMHEAEEAAPARSAAKARRRDEAAPAVLRGKKKASSGKAGTRRATVRYYSRMNPDRVFPLLVMLTRQEVEKIVQKHVEQTATGPLKIAKDVPLEIEPVLPGCVCHPPVVVTKLESADQSFTFHVVPHVVGEVTGARVLIRQDHATLAEIPLDIRVVQRTWVIVSGLSTFLLPTASAVMGNFGVDFTPKDGSSPYLAAMKFLFTQVSPPVLMAALAVLTGLAWWYTRPKGRDAFWDINTKPPTGTAPA
jgi:hypothetical protein